MSNNQIELIGVYIVDENPDVSLIELLINQKARDINIAEFTQEIKNRPRLSWQAPFLEKYLDLEGRSVIGDYFKLPKVQADYTRLTFFIYFLDVNKPLLTPFGKLKLFKKIKAPERIKRLIHFEDPE